MTLLPDAVAVSEPGGAPWLVSRRREAAARLASVAVPDGEAEVWRYSPIGRLDLADYEAGPERSNEPSVVDPGDAAARVELHNGQIRSVGVSADATAAGLQVIAGRDVSVAPLETPVSDEYVSLLAETLASDPVYITIAPGAVIDGPVVVDHLVDGPAPLVGTLVCIGAGADSEVTVVERRRSDDQTGLVLPLVDIDLDAAARVRYVDAQLLGAQTWQLGQQRARVGPQATLSMYQAGLGGDYARMRTDCALVGRGATGNLSAVYFGGGNQTLDFRTFQEHVAPDTTSELLFKGVVDDAARSIYSGLIRVGPEARGTTAFQTNRNIKLAETAWAESVPNLEIENNDVRCSHASTVGPIDEDQRFYLESRGVPPAEADRLILAGFFDEVLADLPAPRLAEDLTARIATRLESASAA